MLAEFAQHVGMDLQAHDDARIGSRNDERLAFGSRADADLGLYTLDARHALNADAVVREMQCGPAAFDLGLEGVGAAEQKQREEHCSFHSLNLTERPHGLQQLSTEFVRVDQVTS
jgi:hypothetical protein